MSILSTGAKTDVSAALYPNRCGARDARRAPAQNAHAREGDTVPRGPTERPAGGARAASQRRGLGTIAMQPTPPRGRAAAMLACEAAA